jgi:polar amino acid transport system substrate-binding protein
VGIPRGETALTDFVNTALRELESTGQAGKIYDTWFGPQSATPLVRNFKIGDKP